jgi:hypothetical protein
VVHVAIQSFWETSWEPSENEPAGCYAIHDSNSRVEAENIELAELTGKFPLSAQHQTQSAGEIETAPPPVSQ